MATWNIEKSISSGFEVLDGKPPRKSSKLPHAVIVSGTTREKPENYELGSESCIKEMQLSS